MRTILCLIFFILSVPAFAQNHMFQFNTGSSVLGEFAFSQSKDRGEKKDDDQSGFLALNFARSVSSHFQVGLEASYRVDNDSDKREESYGALIGIFYNFTEDLFPTSAYLSVFSGFEWGHVLWDNDPNEHSEALVTKISLGKRFPIAFISENFTFSPEVSYKTTNMTTSENPEWKQELIFKVLQFSVFF